MSVAAAPLAAWVKANVAFSKVLEKVEPLEGRLKQLTESLEASRERLVQCEDDLSHLDEQVTPTARAAALSNIIQGTCIIFQKQ